METTNAPVFGPPLHTHPETEVFHVLAGRYLYEVDGRRFHSESADVITVPGGMAHAFVNVTDAPARQFILIMPGLDVVAFFKGLRDLTRDGKIDVAAPQCLRREVELQVPWANLDALDRMTASVETLPIALLFSISMPGLQ